MLTECELTKCGCRLDERFSRYVKGKQTDRRSQKILYFVDKAVQSLSQRREPHKGRLPAVCLSVYVCVWAGEGVGAIKGLPAWIQYSVREAAATRHSDLWPKLVK